MKRKILEQMKKWKERSDRKPLVLEGARQVGKTWLMREFGRLYFDDVAEFLVYLRDQYALSEASDTEVDLLSINGFDGLYLEGAIGCKYVRGYFAQFFFRFCTSYTYYIFGGSRRNLHQCNQQLLKGIDAIIRYPCIM